MFFGIFFTKNDLKKFFKILLSVMSMLAEPNCESAANVDAAKMWRDERAKFISRADRSVKASLNL